MMRVFCALSGFIKESLSGSSYQTVELGMVSPERPKRSRERAIRQYTKKKGDN